MKEWFEVGTPGQLNAFDTFEEAEQFANENGCKLISQCGGAWDDFIKCDLCGEFVPSYEMHNGDECENCFHRGLEHGF